MLNRIRSIRKAKVMTLADVAEACDPPTTAQTIGRIETGMRTLSVRWMERIGAALDVEPAKLLQDDRRAPPSIVATLGDDGVNSLEAPREAVLPSELVGNGPLMAMSVMASTGEYRMGDTLWLRQITPQEAASAINRDILVPRKGGRFYFGRLIDRQKNLVGILPPGLGQKQQVVQDPPWIGVAEMLVRPL